MNAQLARILPRHASFTYRGKNNLTVIIYDLRIFHKITTRLWRRYFIKKLEQFNLTQQSLPSHYIHMSNISKNVYKIYQEADLKTLSKSVCTENFT